MLPLLSVRCGEGELFCAAAASGTAPTTEAFGYYNPNKRVRGGGLNCRAAAGCLYNRPPWQSTLRHPTAPGGARSPEVSRDRGRRGWPAPGRASPRCERSSAAAGSGGWIIRSSCWHSGCTPGAIKAQQWPGFSSVTRSNGTASRIPRNFPFIAAVATERLYEAEGISDPAVKYFPNSLRRQKR